MIPPEAPLSPPGGAASELAKPDSRRQLDEAWDLPA
jgi:hypothetical protein